MLGWRKERASRLRSWLSYTRHGEAGAALACEGSAKAHGSQLVCCCSCRISRSKRRLKKEEEAQQPPNGRQPKLTGRIRSRNPLLTTALASYWLVWPFAILISALLHGCYWSCPRSTCTTFQISVLHAIGICFIAFASLDPLRWMSEMATLRYLNTQAWIVAAITSVSLEKESRGGKNGDQRIRIQFLHK